MARILDKKVKINKLNVKAFFNGRKKRFTINPLTAVIYQDKNPKLAEERDAFEKKKILSLIEFAPEDNVLDIACGIGRWSDVLAPQVKTYLGVDYCEDFIDYAISTHKDYPNTEFKVLEATKINAETLERKKYSKILIAGLLLYLNDDEVIKLFSNLVEISSSNSVIYLREPIAVEHRLSLDNVWSEELEQNYSAIYRTKKELIDLLSKSTVFSSFKISYEGDMYDESLNNRKETKQYIFIFQKND